MDFPLARPARLGPALVHGRKWILDLQGQWRPTKKVEVKMGEPMISHSDGGMPVASCQCARCQWPGARERCPVFAVVGRDAGT